MLLPRLYAIIDRGSLDARGVSVAEFAREMREAGVRLLQYRDKEGSPQQVLQAAAEIASVFEGADATLILNDRADLAVLAGWDGVHVGQGDLPVEAVRRVLGAPDGQEEGRFAFDELGGMTGRRAMAIVGLSTHNDDQVRAAAGHGRSGPDYIAVGPVFGTATKQDAEPAIGLEGVRRARALTGKPMVAIGGITLHNAASVLEAGADSLAVIGGLWVPGRRPRDVAAELLQICGG